MAHSITSKTVGKQVQKGLISLSKINMGPLMPSLGIQASVSLLFGIGSFFLTPQDGGNLLALFWEGSQFMGTWIFKSSQMCCSSHKCASQSC